MANKNKKKGDPQPEKAAATEESKGAPADPKAPVPAAKDAPKTEESKGANAAASQSSSAKTQPAAADKNAAAPNPTLNEAQLKQLADLKA